MIDYVNIGLKNKELAMKILANPLFEFTTEESKNGHNVYKGAYKNMKIEIYAPSHIIYLKGSLHYFYNNGIHNYNDFTYENLCESIDTLASLFGFNPHQTQLHSLEFGVNIELPYAPTYFIQNVLAFNNAKLLAMVKDLPIDEALNVSLSQYRLKLYDKGKQFVVDGKQVLRIEFKAIKMASLKSINGLGSLASLRNKKVLALLGQKLLKEFETLIVAENLAEGITVPEKELEKYTSMCTKGYWKAIKNPSNKRNAKARFKDLKGKYGKRMQAYIGGLIRQIWGELLDFDGWQVVQNIAEAAPPVGINLPPLPKAQNTPLALFDHLDNRLDYAYNFNSNSINHNYLFNKINKCSNCRKVLPNNTESYCNASCKAKKDIRNNKTSQRQKALQYTACQSLFDYA